MIYNTILNEKGKVKTEIKFFSIKLKDDKLDEIWK